MLEIKSSKKQIKINDMIFEMRTPSYKDSIEYSEKIKSCGDDVEKKTSCLFDYLEKLGLSKDVSIDLEIGHVFEIINYLTGEKKS